MSVNAEKFALAVVASSDSKLSVQEKFELYQDAYSYTQSENKKLNEKDKKNRTSAQEKINQLKKMGL
ncbi:hypothetical protein CV769_14560 [Enterococcus mundtii]|uniref:Uncharacterized protein n=1 Tax=Enterococcus mundtii TaxID=53346 RepID=A0A2M9FMF7_ENTMU|nr:hypothetical protein [Enterococcus mundtii]NMP58068.1 hypothetical protein [Enterococcus mundtii]PJK24627.1 hypothetical protein CV769_14560 [Enterococcus mundtii]